MSLHRMSAKPESPHGRLSILVLRAAEHCATVALHEGGHAVVARSFGSRAETCFLLEGSYLWGCTTWDNLPEHETRLVALAGAIATILWAHPDVTAEQTTEWMPEVLGPRDAKDAGDYSGADVAECLQIVRSHWTEVEAEAATLLQSFITRPEQPPGGFFNVRALFPEDDIRDIPEGSTASLS